MRLPIVRLFLLSLQSIPYVDIPEYSFIQVVPRAYTCLTKVHKITFDQ